MKRLAGVTALVAIALGLTVWLGSQRAAAARTSTHTKRSSRLLLGGRVRCTATVRSEVQVGHFLRVRLVLHNLSKHSVEISGGSGLVLHAGDGTIYDTGGPLQGWPVPPPPLRPAKLAPGATKSAGSQVIAVRWRGPLRITPGCDGKALPALRVWVTAPGAPADESAAVDEVVAAAGHLLDQCRPQAPGVAVNGQIYPPSGSAPPMSAQCTVSIDSEGAFWVAQVLVAIPSGVAGVQVYQPYETLWPTGSFPEPTISPPYEAIAWQFVVTRERAIPVAASTMAAGNPSGETAPVWIWRGTAFQSGGTGSCAGTSFGGGGTGPEIEFISACSG